MTRLLPVLALAALAACGSKAPADPLAPPLGLEAATLIVPADDPMTPAKIELGKTLFFDQRLSATGKMACVTCHLPELAWTDGKPVSPKFDGSPNTRNAPSMFNVGYLEKLYWDGRAPSLEKNITAAWQKQMGAKTDEVSKTIAGVAAYGPMFEQAFGKGQPPSEATISRALGAFLRALRSGNSAFDRWTAGTQDALTKEQKLGREIFWGKGGCIACHTAPLFTDRSFHNTGMGTGVDKPDLGAGGEKALNDPKFTSAFKTPSLRNVAKTAPYFHDGSVKELREAVKFMAGGGKDNPNKDVALLNRNLSDQEIDQLVAFLESLTGDVPFTAPKVPQ